ncbi:M15 family metallopeptidase [Borrelia miyamotoi]|uniref:M15 family metallopeptidase n=1 Tax=Borrelia miyamotoi TaxID=47466 RepID=A0AAX3JLI4_9SPIR|nr:M15 family metallopeptidase [Borrelia miyamotoi]QFP41777.1 M15 family metallopeptidase [Borrelia miyamotoi]QFP47897.1 M15 family metallopeptidase [Borrelia miyamotoi]QGT55657.1 D-alanyl-D-alanine carboxypeptidase family protein [Borrelia miyamotoi]QGT56440.1 D-alanyl-D-alanine carboxypeptidase family protein [Borrelia miyamotoi]WAZ71686.1 M15 family metallopeptidase [Borrelia miyamotoi]
MGLLNIFSLTLLINNLTFQSKNTISKQDLAILIKTTKDLYKPYQKEIKNNPIQFIKEIKPLLEAEKNDLLILVNKKIPIPKEYNPTDLVHLKDFKELKNIGKESLMIRKILIDDLINLVDAGKENGFQIKIMSAYRTKEYQKFLFEYNVKAYGKKIAKIQSAIPNHSQHQLGTTIDFIKIDDNLLNTKAGKWLYENSLKYGFSLSYPKNHERETGYKSEPWHYMYIGKQACTIQKKYFNNLQYKLLEFWNKHKKELSKLIQKYSN